MAVPERALIGWKEIAEYLGLTYGQSIYQCKDMVKSGLIFHRVVMIPGHKGKRHRIVYTFPSLLQKYLITKELNAK